MDKNRVLRVFGVVVVIFAGVIFAFANSSYHFFPQSRPDQDVVKLNQRFYSTLFDQNRQTTHALESGGVQYVDHDFGFKVTIPAGWRVENNKTSTSSSLEVFEPSKFPNQPTASAQVKIEILADASGTELSAFKKAYTASALEKSEFYSVETSVDGEYTLSKVTGSHLKYVWRKTPGSELRSFDGRTFEYFFFDDNSVIYAVKIATGDETAEKYSKEINAIINSIEFSQQPAAELPYFVLKNKPAMIPLSATPLAKLAKQSEPSLEVKIGPISTAFDKNEYEYAFNGSEQEASSIVFTPTDKSTLPATTSVELSWTAETFDTMLQTFITSLSHELDAQSESYVFKPDLVGEIDLAEKNEFKNGRLFILQATARDVSLDAETQTFFALKEVEGGVVHIKASIDTHGLSEEQLATWRTQIYRMILTSKILDDIGIDPNQAAAEFYLHALEGFATIGPDTSNTVLIYFSVFGHPQGDVYTKEMISLAKAGKAKIIFMVEPKTMGKTAWCVDEQAKLEDKIQNFYDVAMLMTSELEMFGNTMGISGTQLRDCVLDPELDKRIRTGNAQVFERFAFKAWPGLIQIENGVITNEFYGKEGLDAFVKNNEK